MGQPHRDPGSGRDPRWVRQGRCPARADRRRRLRDLRHAGIPGRHHAADRRRLRHLPDRAAAPLPDQGESARRRCWPAGTRPIDPGHPPATDRDDDGRRMLRATAVGRRAQRHPAPDRQPVLGAVRRGRRPGPTRRTTTSPAVRPAASRARAGASRKWPRPVSWFPGNDPRCPGRRDHRLDGRPAGAVGARPRRDRHGRPCCGIDSRRPHRPTRHRFHRTTQPPTQHHQRGAGVTQQINMTSDEDVRARVDALLSRDDASRRRRVS